MRVPSRVQPPQDARVLLARQVRLLPRRRRVSLLPPEGEKARLRGLQEGLLLARCVRLSPSLSFSSARLPLSLASFLNASLTFCIPPPPLLPLPRLLVSRLRPHLSPNTHPPPALCPLRLWLLPLRTLLRLWPPQGRPPPPRRLPTSNTTVVRSTRPTATGVRAVFGVRPQDRRDAYVPAQVGGSRRRASWWVRRRWEGRGRRGWGREGQ